MARGKKVQEEDKKRRLNKGGFKNLMKLYAFFKPYKTYFLLGMFALVFSSTILLAFPYLTGELMNTAIPNYQSNTTIGMLENYTINQITLILIGVILVQSIFSYFRIFLARL